MSAEFKADAVELQATADGLDQLTAELTDQLDKHMRAVRGFVGVEWTGTAANSHEDPWAKWENGARQILGSFRTDAGLLRRVADEITAVDQSRAAATQRAGSSLDLPDVV
ncbi:WXG100 family type VII secretion target [Nocardia sp. NPDC088792]|uniref:WXG100 family type VII secretion target n=1 Tax=Nocardia sp. NPDC088792 TaxID=3364332 RepID=UPI00381F949A